MLPLYLDICKQLNLDKDDKPRLTTLAHCLLRVGDVAPDVMVYLSRGRDCCGLIVIGVKRSCDPSKIGKP